MRNRVISHLLGIVGAVIGGALGLYLFLWITRSGFYGLMIPGALLGVGCSLLAQHASLGRGIACGIAAVLLGLYAEWRFAPFVADGSFGYLLTHFMELKPITLIMIALGGL